MKNCITDFLKLMKDDERECTTLNILGEEMIALDFDDAIEKINELGVDYIIDTYFEGIIFKSLSNEIYELGIL